MSSNENNKVENSMFASVCKKSFAKFGVEINGDKPGDIIVNKNSFYFHMCLYSTGFNRLALGESYMNGEWDCDDLHAFLEKAIQSNIPFKKSALMIGSVIHSLPLLTMNMQTKSRAKKDIHHHYDLGNDLFKLMLDRSMNYSCGYWTKNAFLAPETCQSNQIEFNSLHNNLNDAQLNKMLLIAKKLNLKPGMTVLDIGCGWGYLCKFLAINFDVHVVGITISKEQFEFAKTTDIEKHELEFMRIPGLKPEGSGTYEFKLIDYRDVKETYDRIVSVGMLEHVGVKNYDTYFKICHRCLKDDGLVLIHTIAICHDYVPQVDPWANKYIFPGGMAPYPNQLIDVTFGRFVIEDWHNMGYNYSRTLVAWYDNFIKNWPQLEGKYDERFKRMWSYYLCSAAMLFKTRKLNLSQIVMSKDGYAGGYTSLR